MSTLSLPLSLDLTQHTRWNATQENALQTYPFAEGVDSEHGHRPESEQEQDHDHAVVRVYLQFLWLPESIMPLSLFVPAIASANATHSSPSSLHPLHALLEPLIMPPRAASNKYYVDLLQILTDGGGAGEIEENMMWFALSFEKREDLAQREEEESEPWRDEKWRQAWLERMERREVQIQILLHFLKLSLPGPKPPDVADTSSSSVAWIRQRSYLPGKQRSQKPTKAPPPLSTRDALEVYMDKMSTWQLMQGLERDRSGKESSTTKTDDERDWIQIFAEDVVEKQFRPYLPELCDLFHEKVFPTSPVSDTNDDDGDIIMPIQSQPSTRSNSPAEDDAGPNSAMSRSISTSSFISKNEMDNASRLSRSRSLSVSLQQERESQRDATNQQKRKKRALNREVSMSRVFKAKSKAPTPALDNASLVFGPATGLQGVKDKRQSIAVGKGKSKAKTVDESEITLVEATPVLNRTKSFSVGTRLGGSKGAEDVDMDDWESELPKSGDVIMGAYGADDDIEAVFVVDTPTKVKRRPGKTKTAAGG